MSRGVATAAPPIPASVKKSLPIGEAFTHFFFSFPSAIKPITPITSGCCGTYAALCIGQMPMRAAAEKLLAWAGKNTILIFGTHHIYYAALGVLLGVKNFAATPIGTGLVILAGVALLEVPTIYVINRWLPFLTGKVRRKTRSA